MPDNDIVNLVITNFTYIVLLLIINCTTVQSTRCSAMSVVLMLVVVDVLLSHGLTETSVEGARSKLWLRAAAACAA